MEKPKLTKEQIALLEEAFNWLANRYENNPTIAIAELRNLVYDQFSDYV